MKMKAFTLTEILVCIGIIALLAAILLPVLFQARKQSLKATCQSNLRQIGFALRQYVSENDEAWPTRDAWQARSFTMVKLSGCPQAVTPPPPDNGFGIDGYAYNTALTTYQPNSSGVKETVGHRDMVIAYPATTVSVCEEAVAQDTSYGPNPYKALGGSPPNGVEKGWLRHNGGANYLFCDGHVKWYLPDAVGYNETPSKEAGHAPTFALAEKAL